MPAGKGNGGLDVDACRVAYVRYLRGLASGKIKTETEQPKKEDHEKLDLNAESARHKKEQADKLEIQNALARREVAPVRLIEDALLNVAEQINAIFDSIPLQVKKAVPGISATALETLKKELIKAKNAASAAKLDLSELPAFGD